MPGKMIQNVRDVAEWRLCLGCGACASVCPQDKIQLHDFFAEGIRPVLDSDCQDCSLCLQTCPSYENDRTAANARAGIIPELVPYCGPVLEIWEGHATDPEIRFRGSSGGLLTILSLYCLEVEKMGGVLHTAADENIPWKNSTRLSRSREELLSATGSRYAPAAVCDSLREVEAANAPCVVVGQPSEITALRKAQTLRPALDKKVGLAMSFFCAGSPSTQGTLDLVQKLGASLEDVEEIRYRGKGWPGMFSVRLKGHEKPMAERTYAESWGFLQAYRPLSVHLCPDGTGEDADITCGDPWYRKVEPGEPGSSLILIRTERGRQLFAAAMKAGYVTAKRVGVPEVLEAQKNLFEKRGAIWGRITVMKLFGLPVTKLIGFNLFRNWLRLSLENKLRSTVGTARRIFSKGWNRPLNLSTLKTEASVSLPASREVLPK